METIYSKVKFKNRGARERGDGDSSKGNSNTNDDIIYSEVQIVQSDKTIVTTTPNADPSHPNQPGPHDPADSSPKVVNPAWAKERLLLRSLCALLLAAGLVVTVLYVLGKIPLEEKVVSENAKRIEQLQSENTNLSTSLAEKGKRIEQLQTENTNLSTSLKGKEENNKDLQDKIGQLSKDLTEKEENNKELQDKIGQLSTDLKERGEKIKQLKGEKGTCDPNLQNLDEVGCAEGWQYFSGKCYYFSDDKKTWTDSRDACVAAGGHLVIITSPEERDFIKRSKPGSDPERYWIGLTDAVKEGDWRWLDGTKLSDTPRYWHGNEPDNWNTKKKEYPEGEDCAQMEVSSKVYTLWDGLCDVQSAKQKRVCEAKASKQV